MALRFFTLTYLLIIDAVICNHQLLNYDESCVCGQSNENIQERIINGKVAVPHVFPWLVAVFYEGNIHCGGALINDRYILTAGHCVYGFDTSELTVGLGVHDIKKMHRRQVMGLEKAILHEDFHSDEAHDLNDIALLKLEEPVLYNDNLQPLCLATRESNYEGEEVKVAGWGRMDKVENIASRYLRQTVLNIMSTDECRATIIGEHMHKKMLCAYAEDTDACQGDSGGPLFHERDSGIYETIGIVSWGYGCADKNSPGVYVQVASYLPWIYKNTADATYCSDY